jgi:hypothetical protein
VYRALSSPNTTATPAPTPAPTRRWETVPPRNQNKVALAETADPGPAQTTGSIMADRRLILRRDVSYLALE